MHELGVRILIRKVQLVGTQYEKALVPILSYSKEHYMRVYFRCTKSKTACDEVLTQHGMFNDAGPLWLGSLGDPLLVAQMLKKGAWIDEELQKFLALIHEELLVGGIGFIDIHRLVERLGLHEIPPFSKIIAELRKQRYSVSHTHFNNVALRTTASEKEIEKIIKKF